MASHGRIDHLLRYIFFCISDLSDICAIAIFSHRLTWTVLLPSQRRIDHLLTATEPSRRRHTFVFDTFPSCARAIPKSVLFFRSPSRIKKTDPTILKQIFGTGRPRSMEMEQTAYVCVLVGRRHPSVPARGTDRQISFEEKMRHRFLALLRVLCITHVRTVVLLVRGILFFGAKPLRRIF